MRPSNPSSVAQIASVSKVLAAAAEAYFTPAGPMMARPWVRQPPHTIIWLYELGETQPCPSRLDSRTLLAWVKHASDLEIDRTIHTVPGALSFLAHACNPCKVTVSCESVLEGAQLDRMLLGCHNISNLSCTGAYVPARVPPGLKELGIHPCWFDPEDEPISGLDMHSFLELLVIRLNTSDTALRSLHVSTVASMAFTEHMPKLQRLSLDFRRQEQIPFDLTWLQHQPFHHLTLAVTLESQEIARQRDLIAQLAAAAVQL